MALFYQGLAQLGAEQAGGGPRVSELEYDGIPVGHWNGTVPDTDACALLLSTCITCAVTAKHGLNSQTACRAYVSACCMVPACLGLMRALFLPLFHPATQVTVVDTAGVPGSSSSAAAGLDAADGFAADAGAAQQQREARAPSRRPTAAAGAGRSQQAVKVSVVEADAQQEAP